MGWRPRGEGAKVAVYGLGLGEPGSSPVLRLPEFSSWEGSGERLLLAVASQNVSSWRAA